LCWCQRSHPLLRERPRATPRLRNKTDITSCRGESSTIGSQPSPCPSQRRVPRSSDTAYPKPPVLDPLPLWTSSRIL
jgi:hypothetical protein